MGQKIDKSNRQAQANRQADLKIIDGLWMWRVSLFWGYVGSDEMR